MRTAMVVAALLSAQGAQAQMDLGGGAINMATSMRSVVLTNNSLNGIGKHTARGARPQTKPIGPAFKVAAFPPGGTVLPKYPNARVYAGRSGGLREVCAQTASGLLCQNFG